jgi:hypothetical protein
MYKFSERLAWTAGVALPLGETLRRWGTWWVFPPAYFDDVLIGMFFLAGAWMSRRGGTAGPRCLAAAYGCACGIGLMSLATAITYIDQPDPTGVSGLTAVLVKAVMVGLGVAGLTGALGGPPSEAAGLTPEVTPG